MYTKGYPAGSTFQEIFDSLNISERIGTPIVNSLMEEGYSQKGICYAVGKSLDKILKFRADNRFAGVFKNEVRKYATNYKTTFNEK